MKKLIILTLLSCIGLSSFSQNTEKNRLKFDFDSETGIGLVRNSLCPMSFLQIGVMIEDGGSMHFNLQSYYKFEKNTSGYFNTYADIYLGIDLMTISSNQEFGLCIGYCPKSQSSNLGKSALKVSVIRKIDFFTISSDLIFTNDIFIGLTMAMGLGD